MLRSGPTPWPPPPRQWAERNAVVGEGIAHGNCTGRRQHCARHCEARRHGRWLPPSVCLARIRSRARHSLEMLLRRDLPSFSERKGRETAQIQENFRAMGLKWTVTQGGSQTGERIRTYAHSARRTAVLCRKEGHPSRHCHPSRRDDSGPIRIEPIGPAFWNSADVSMRNSRPSSQGETGCPAVQCRVRPGSPGHSYDNCGNCMAAR